KALQIRIAPRRSELAVRGLPITLLFAAQANADNEYRHHTNGRLQSALHFRPPLQQQVETCIEGRSTSTISVYLFDPEYISAADDSAIRSHASIHPCTQARL